ncbi:hypothetical protein [Streptomyces natalensis]|uniref:hypothetical protein n=1 Tax=Streptomyces natalensis TaxID=68242 RepID=UPI000ACD12EE|nr:hypothetical protein [Streptomyces natalensis]
MAIRKSYVPSEIYGVPRPRYQVEGDTPWVHFTTEDEAKAREAKLAGRSESKKD